MHVLQVLVEAVAIPGFKRELTSIMLPAAVIVKARFGDSVQDASIKVRSAVGSLEATVVALPVIVHTLRDMPSFALGVYRSVWMPPWAVSCLMALQPAGAPSVG